MSNWLLRIGVVLVLLSPMPSIIYFKTDTVLANGVISHVNAQVKYRGASPTAFVDESLFLPGPEAIGLVFWRESQDVNLALGGMFLLSVLVSVGLVVCAGLCFWARPKFVPVGAV